MKIISKQINSVTVLRFTESSRLSSLHSYMVKEQMKKVLYSPGAKLAIDFEGINFIDSSGFSALLSAYKTAKENNSSLKLCNISQEVFELIELMQLDTIFDIQSNLESCLKSFTFGQ